MKIAYITTIAFPSTYANRLQILQMINALANEGHTISLLCKYVKDFSFNNKVNKVELATNSSVTTSIKFYQHLTKNSYDAWYIREARLLFFLLLYFRFLFKKIPYIIYEIHDMPRSRIEFLAIRVLPIEKVYIVAITNALKEDLVDKMGVPSSSIGVHPDAVDIDRFDKSVSKPDARERVGYNSKKPLVVYSGSIQKWKGVYFLVDLAKQMPHLHFMFVGGHPNHLKQLQDYGKGQSNITLVGHVRHDEIPFYLKAADILVLPNSRSANKEREVLMSERYTSPLKLFEYMATNRPIVASKLPSICEILKDKKNAYLADPDNLEDFMQTIEYALIDKNNMVITSQAYQDVIKRTWSNRVRDILKGLETKSV